MDDFFIKLICGAGNENVNETEKLAYIFSLAGFNMIDVCANKYVINAARSGIEKAGKKGFTDLCVSIGLQDDIHLTKAVVNKSKCNLCMKCISSCMQNAMFSEDEKLYVDEKKCIGCGACIKECECDAIIVQNKYKSPVEMLLPVLSECPECVEFHCSGGNEKLIIDTFHKIKSVYGGLISLCTDREKFSDNAVINLLKTISADFPDVIIQADGTPMSGGKDDYNSSLQTVSFADIIRKSGIESRIILSGGTNSKTAQVASLFNVKINGVALGSYARKSVKEYIMLDDFWQNTNAIACAVAIAEKIHNELKQNL